jgi:hypothetical protein
MERLRAKHLVDVLPSNHPLGQKVDERIRFRVDVVAVEHHFGIIEHLSQSPYQRLRITCQRLIGSQAVQIHTVGLEGCVVAHVLEGLRAKPQACVLP